VEKVAQINFQINAQRMGEKSPNLVTLLAAKEKRSLISQALKIEQKNFGP
jgi:hypothetical protein